jgi:type IV secretion system protein VirB4
MLSSLLKKQLAGEEYLPKYRYHVTDSIVSLVDDRVMFTLSCTGVPFDVVSDLRLDSDYDSLNNMLLSIAKGTGSRLAVWFHHDHYKTQFETEYKFTYRWMEDFATRYMQKFDAIDVFENTFYMTFILKPSMNDTIEDCIKELQEIQQTVTQLLGSYEPHILTVYTHNDHVFSQTYEFLAYLYNGFWERMPVTSLPLQQCIETSNHYHGYKLIETRYPDGGNVYSAYYDLKDIPDPIYRGNMNAMLDLPFEFMLCHSFTFIDQADAMKLINSTLNKMESAGDEAIDQMADLGIGKSMIASGTVYFGEYHGAMLVRGATEKQAEDRGATARTTMSGSCGSMYMPATMSAPATFYSMFPAAFKHRPRISPRTTRNVLGNFSMNTFSSGKHYGNPIGDGTAVMPLQTSAHGVYHFNFHYSLPDLDVRGDKLAGHTHICGATGAGKTVLQTTLLSFIERFNCKLFAIDKDGSMRGYVEAIGGTYFTLKAGEPTGLNPFQLPDTKLNRDFLNDLVSVCGRPSEGDLTPEDVQDIKKFIDNVYEMPFEYRRLGLALQSIPDRGEDCLSRRLAKWCYSETDEGRYAYALDNPKNNFDWEKLTRVGFDVTDFLVAGHPATEPILSYLFHLKKLIKGEDGLMATVVEEYWLPISYPTTAAQILDSLKTGRRRDEFIVLVTQSPEDAIKSPLLPAILQQTPTKIYLPNPDAEYRTVDGGGYSRFGLTEKEFDKLKSLGTQSRKFLVKQGSQTNVAKLDLAGMGDVMGVLAMAAEDFKYLEAAKAQVGDHPDEWIPLYKKLRQADSKKVKQAEFSKSR